MTLESKESTQQIAAEMGAYVRLLKSRSFSPLSSAAIYAREGAKQQLASPMVMKNSPTGMKVFSGISTAGSRYFATHSKYRVQTAYLKEHWRDIQKTQKGIDRIKYVVVEEPGVIPRILAVVETILDRVNKEEQPRIEQILDSANGNLVNSREILDKINTGLGSIFSLISGNQTLVKIGLIIAAVAVVVTMVLIPIVLIRIILFGL